MAWFIALVLGPDVQDVFFFGFVMVLSLLFLFFLFVLMKFLMEVGCTANYNLLMFFCQKVATVS